jgi:signal transduction histidine kinase
MEGLLGSTLVGERGSLALEVFDGSELQGEAASASSSESVVVDRVGGESALRLFTAAKRVEAGGHTWMVTAQALPNFATPIAISQLQLVTIVGGASSVALALFTWALMRRRLRSLHNREELQLAKDRAEAANRAKSHFLAAASHDLRQPTQALGLFIATLRAMAKKPQLRGEDVGHVASRLQLAMEGLGRLLNGLLDVSRLEAGAVEVTLAPMPVQDVPTQVQNAFAGPAQAKGLEAQGGGEPALGGERSGGAGADRSNLVANAVRYTGGKVLVGCRRRDRVRSGDGYRDRDRGGPAGKDLRGVLSGGGDGEGRGTGVGAGVGDRARVGGVAGWGGGCQVGSGAGVVLFDLGTADGTNRAGTAGRGADKSRGAIAAGLGRRR